MKHTIVLFVICFLQASLSAAENKLDQESPALWQDGKITPEQPFQAKIVAAGGLSPWSGETAIYLREEGDHGRYLQAKVGVVTGSGIQYKELAKADFDEVLKWKGGASGYNACVYITPVEVSQFVYVSPLGDAGAKMGEADVVKKAYLSALQSNAVGSADKSTVAPDGNLKIEDEWQRLAELIPYVHYGDFLYNRLPRNPSEVDSPRLKALQAAMATPADLAKLKKLVEHKDSKIRALALMKLYLSGNPNAFRVIQSRLGDEGLAFPGQSQAISQPFLGIGMTTFTAPKIDTHEQTIGRLAQSMMSMIDSPRSEEFEAWAKPRLDNPDWMGWYEFLLKRITQGTSPVPEGIDAELAVFEKLLDQRPPALRAWLGFVVADDAMMVPREDTLLGTRDELIEKGKVLGPDALLVFLRDGTRAGLMHPKVDDPENGTRFILRHAKHFFRKNDAEALHEMGHYIAAVDVRPEMASSWVREACAKWSETYDGWDRARAMAALLEYSADKELKYVVDWFYATEPISSGTTDQDMFITEYQRRRPADWKKSMTALVAHPDFESMGTMALIYLALMVNDLHGETVVDKELLTDEREAELHNAIRRALGMAEKSVKWIDWNDEGKQLEPEWSAPLDGTATRMEMSPDGTLLAILMDDKKIRIHRAPGGAFLGEIPANDDVPVTLGFHRTNGSLMVVGFGGKVDFWNLQTLQLEREVKIEGFGAHEVCLDPGGEWLATRQANNVGISVHDLKTGTPRWNIPMPIRAFGLIGASPDGSRFVVCDGFTRTVLLFDPAKAEPLARLDGHSGEPGHVVFSSDGATMVTSGDDTKIMVWNARTGAHIAEYASRRKHASVMACGGDSPHFFFGGRTGKITQVDLTDGRVIQSLKFAGKLPQAIAKSNNAVTGIVFGKAANSTLVGWSLKDE